MKKSPLFPRLAALVLAGALALGMAGCGSSAPDTAAAQNQLSASEETTASSGGGAALLDPSATGESSRKIVYTASVDLESTDFDGAQAAVLDAVEQSGGYLEATDLWGSAEDADRTANYTVRVPADNYRQLLAALGNAASLLSQSESASDVTSNYIDVEARLTALENQRDRLNELADQAETTADLLEIESQLSDVQYQIESYTAQMRDLNSRIAYSTVNVSLREVAVLTPTGTTFADRLATAFFGGWHAFADFMQGLFLTIVYLLPLLLLVAAVVVLLVVLGRRRRARRAAHPPVRPASYAHGGAKAPHSTGPEPPQPPAAEQAPEQPAKPEDAAAAPSGDTPKPGPKY